MHDEFVFCICSESFITLVDNLIPLLAMSTEHLKMSLTIVNSYALIYPESFALKYGPVVFSELNTAMGDMRAEGVGMVLRCVETILRTSPTQGPLSIKPLVGKIFQYVTRVVILQKTRLIT